MALDLDQKEHTFGAGETLTVEGGTHFSLTDATSPVQLKFFRKNQLIGSADAAEAGHEITFSPRPDGAPTFDRMTIYSASAQTVKFYYTAGAALTRSGKFSGSVEVTQETPPGTLTAGTTITAGGANATGTIAANTSRKEIIIQSKDDNTGRIWIGDTGGANGLQLQVGGTLTLETTAAVPYRIETSGDDILFIELEY